MHRLTNERLFGLIGYPLIHSHSKLYFNDKFKREGLNCRYENFELPDLKELKSLFGENSHLSGLNVTIPHKENILAHLNEIDDEAKSISAVNTIRVMDGKTIGYNTDSPAFKETLSDLISNSAISKGLVLGDGGASKAVCFALNELGIEPVVVSRKAKEDSNPLNYEDLDSEVMEKCRLIVNATSLGTFPETNAFPDIPYEFLGPEHILYDLVYNPGKTEFLKRGEEMGCKIKNGMEMFRLQAEFSWELWNRKE